MAFIKIAKTVLRSLLCKPATLMYPIKVRGFYKATRGKVKIEIDSCVFCGFCRNKCPTSAIAVDRNAKTWDIDRLKCIACGYCVEVCPKKCLKMENLYSHPSSGASKESFTNARVPRDGEDSKDR